MVRFELVRSIINVHVDFISVQPFYSLYFKKRERERKEGVVSWILAYRLTTVCQPIRVDINRDAIDVAGAYI